MKLKHLITTSFLWSIIFFLLGCDASYQAQSGDAPPSGNPGDCHAKARIINDDGTEKLEWAQVLCPKKHTCSNLIRINKKLSSKGYKVGKVTKSGVDTATGHDLFQFDDASKAALVKFQKDNNLPIGRIDKKTLKALDIYIDDL